ncbi:MAG: hypothetical protein AAF548_04950 [Actinomycetota bacterium]
MEITGTTPSRALHAMRDGWSRIVAALPTATVWAVEAEFVGTTATGRAAATRGILSHDDTRLRFTDWRGTVLVDERLRDMSGSIMKGDLRCEIAERVLTFDDFASLAARTGSSPPFAGDPADALIAALTALHRAR